nr:hypothetical protein [Lactobacillus delbrueckii]
MIDIQNMKLAECEALSRWIDPRYGFLSPPVSRQVYPCPGGQPGSLQG